MMAMLISWLIQALIATALLVPVVVILCRLFHRQPLVQHALWVVVLLKFITPPLIWLPVSPSAIISNLTHHDSGTAAPSKAIPAEQLFKTLELDKPTALSNTADQGPIDDVIALESSLTSIAARSEQPMWRSKVMAGLFLLWLLGAIACVLRNVCQVWKQNRVIRRASPASDQLTGIVAEVARKLRLRPLRTKVLSGIASPFVWCLGRLQLIWPESMTSPEYEPSVRSIIAHELSHVRRRDHWIVWLEMSASLVWWWNPVYWFVRNQIRATAELACDAIALANYPDDRSLYAETLFALSVPKTVVPTPGLAVGTGTPSTLERRITMIMSEHISEKLSLRDFLAVALLGLVAFPAWSLAQDAKNEGKAPEVTESAGKAGQLIAVVGTEHILAGDMAVFVEPIIDQNRGIISSAAEEQKVREQLTRQALRQYVEIKALYQEFFRDMLGTRTPKELELTKDKVTNRAGRIFFEKQVPALFKKYEVDTIPALEAKLQEQSISLSSLQSLFVEQVLASELEHKYVPHKFEIEREPAQVKDLAEAHGTLRDALSYERRNKEIRDFREQIMARTAVWTLWPSDIPGARPLEETP